MTAAFTKGPAPSRTSEIRMSTEFVQILWPERRMVSAETIKMWASDSFYNNADAYTEDDTPIYRDFTSGPPSSLEDCIEWLDTMGEVTFAKRRVES